MKSKLYIKIFLLLSFFFLYQSVGFTQCALPTPQIDLDANNVSARLLIGGDLWWDGADGRYIVPKASQVSAIFAGGLWMGGLDPGGNLKLAAQTYGTSSGRTDYYSGPLSETGETSSNQCDNFDRFWRMNAQDINEHLADYDDNGVIDGPVPTNVLAWPGLGNPEFFEQNGFDLPDTAPGLAPFFDRNANGIYEPMEGDYPLIKDADQARWWVFNDAGNIHTSSQGDPLKMEVQVLAYSYSSTQASINNTTFYDYQFISRGTETLDSAFVGLWIDFDLGCFIDDYVGCIPDKNLGYVYNSDPLDGITSCSDCQGVNTYCEDIPIVGVKLLEGIKDIENGNLVDRGMSSFSVYNNGGANPPPPPGTSDPSDPGQYYNLLNGVWPDGTPLTTGGNGYNPGSTDITKYLFPGAPNDNNEWSMCSENLPETDQRVVMGSGPFTIQPGQVNSMSFAVVYADGITYPCPDLDPFITAADEVQDFYDGLILSNEELASRPANIEISPNPMIDQAIMYFNELEENISYVEVYTMDGKKVRAYDQPTGNSLTIQRTNLSPGIYFYKLLTKDFQIHSGRFIIQ